MTCLVTCKSAAGHTIVTIRCNVPGKLEMQG